MLTLKAAGMLDIDAGEIVRPGILRIDGDRNAGAAGRPDGEVVDLGDLTLLPGLMDMEVNLLMGGRGETAALSLPPPAAAAVAAATTGPRVAPIARSAASPNTAGWMPHLPQARSGTRSSTMSRSRAASSGGAGRPRGRTGSSGPAASRTRRRRSATG